MLRGRGEQPRRELVVPLAKVAKLPFVSVGPLFGLPGSIPKLFDKLFPDRLEFVASIIRRGRSVDLGRAWRWRGVFRRSENPNELAEMDHALCAVHHDLRAAQLSGSNFSLYCPLAYAENIGCGACGNI